MAAALPFIAIGATVLGTMAQASAQQQAGAASAAQGVQQKELGDYQAQVYDQNAGQARAAASHQGEITARNTDLVLSKARAGMAASGTRATGAAGYAPIADLAGRGEYDVLSQLSTGEERARGYENQASIARWMGPQYVQAGQVQQQAGDTRASATILGGAASLFSKYGAGGFGGSQSGYG